MQSPDTDLAQPVWHVLGAGAMGCLWAARLWQYPPLEHRVALLLRSAEELQAYGLRGGVTVEEDADVSGPFLIPAESATDAGPPLCHLLVATKAQDVAAALQSVQARLTPDTRIVLLQNGVRVQREITEQYGAERVFCLSTSHGAWRRAPFHVVHAGHGTAWLGQLAGGSDTALDALLDLLPADFMQVSKDPQIARRLWLKFAVNCAVNALTVLYDCRNGELLEIPQARQELDALVAEIDGLLRTLPDVPVLPDLHGSVAEVLRVAARNISSTLQDARHGRSTELGHLNGYLRDLARAHGLPCPLNEQLLQRVESRLDAPAP